MMKRSDIAEKKIVSERDEWQKACRVVKKKKVMKT